MDPAWPKNTEMGPSRTESEEMDPSRLENMEEHETGEEDAGCKALVL